MDILSRAGSRFLLLARFLQEQNSLAGFDVVDTGIVSIKMLRHVKETYTYSRGTKAEDC
jgi:hypothetical protein